MGQPQTFYILKSCFLDLTAKTGLGVQELTHFFPLARSPGPARADELLHSTQRSSEHYWHTRLSKQHLGRPRDAHRLPRSLPVRSAGPSYWSGTQYSDFLVNSSLCPVLDHWSLAKTETICGEPVRVAGKYGHYCEPFDASKWSPALQPLAKLVQGNDPSGIPAVNFMGGIVRRICLVLRDCRCSDCMSGGLHSTHASNDPWVGVLPMQRPGY